jgi:hypothetical protein
MKRSIAAPAAFPSATTTWDRHGKRGAVDVMGLVSRFDAKRLPHPMHLHGHEFQVVEIDGERFPGAVRDTILLTPGRRVVVAFDA